MLDKKKINFRRKRMTTPDKHYRYSIRKFNVGIASVAIAAFMFLGNGAVSVSANDLASNEEVIPTSGPVSEEDLSSSTKIKETEPVSSSTLPTETPEETPTALPAQTEKVVTEETVPVAENADSLPTNESQQESLSTKESDDALAAAKKVLEEVISEAEVLSADALRKAAKSTADTSSLQSAANATKAAAEAANQVFADEHASLEDINAQITAIRTAVGNLGPELTSFTGTEEVTVMLAATTSGAADANQSGIDAISANNGQYTAISVTTQNFKWTDIEENPIIALKMADGTYKYKKFSGTVTVDIAKEAQQAGQFEDAATYKAANGPLQAGDKVYIIQESDFTSAPTSIEESYDLTKFHHRQNLVFGGDSISEGATIDDAASDSVLVALARPGSFVSEIEFKNMENPGTPSIYLPEENNTLLVVDNIREAVEQAGPNDQSYTNFGLFLSHIAVSDDKVNKPNTVMKLPEGVEVVFADSSGQQTTFAGAMNEIMAALQYNTDEWTVLNPQQKLKFKFIVKKDGQIIQEDKNWREITLHVYNTLDAVKNLVKTTLENTENNFAKGIVDNIDFSGLPEVMKNEAVEMEKKYPNVDGSTPQDGALPQFSNPDNKQYNWINKDEETSNGNHATSPARYFPYDMDLFQGDGDDITEALRGYIPYINDYTPTRDSGEPAKIEPSDHDKELIDYYSLGPIFTKTMFGHNFTPEPGGVNESYWNSLVQDIPIPQLDFEPEVNLDIVTLSETTPPSTPQPKTYNVTHTFVKAASVPENIELPEAIKSKIESSYNYTDVVNGDSRTPNSAINTDRYEDADNDGVWTFNRWQQDSVTVAKADAELVGEWNFTPNKYKITHEFKAADGVTKELPDAIKNRITEASNLTDLLNGSDNQPNPAISTTDYVDETNDGTWTFTGWDKANHVINKADGHFVGTWTFTPSTPGEKPAKVVHEFVSGTPGKELPQEVKDLLPSDFDTKFDETVEPKQPTETTVKVSDGTWTFTSYDETSKVVNEAEEKFIGTWTFTPSTPGEKPAKVVHEFVSGTPGKELPQEVKDLLPSDFDTKFDETVEPKQPTETTVKVSDGTWTFTSYDETSKVVNEAEEKFIGTWTFTPSTPAEKPAKVVHEFVSGTPGKELPQEVKDLLPSDFDTKFDETVEPKQPTENAVKVSDGTWTFTEYDADSKVVNEAEEKFVGTWTFTPSTPAEKPAKVVHEFVSGTPGKELPQEVKDLLPSDFDTKFDETVEPKQPTGTTVEVSDGTWTFTEYDADSKVVNEAEEKFVGTWTFTPSTPGEKPAKVVHEFVSGTPDKELPQEVKDLLPSGFDTKFDETVEPKQPTETTVEVSDGTWTFTSYDETSKVVNEAEEKFVGTWTFTPSTPGEKPAKVVHEFVSGTPGKELPQEVKDLLPSGFDTKFDETVEPKQPTKITVEVSDGTWTFTSYDADSKVVNEAEEKFVGTWTFTPSTPAEKPAKVVHEFVSGTPGKELPQEVKDLLPSDFDTKFDETVRPTTPTETTVKVSDGTWTFTSYDADSKVVNEAEEKFVGTWTFTPSTPAEKPAKVVHEFVSGTPGKELPQEVKDLLPSDFDTKFDETVRPTTPTETTVKVSDGTWTFTSYDADSKVVNEAEEKFVGTWTFTPSTPGEKPAKVVHEFVSGTPGKELPQEVKDLLPSGFDTKFDETVRPTTPTETTVTVSDGTWTFTSYDADSKVVDEAEEKFVGTWTFTPSTPAEKPAKVVHEFVSGTPDKELPQEVKALLPSDFDTKFDETVEPKQPTETTVEVSDGTWTFTSYDADSKVVNEAEEKFVGTWTFTPSEAPAEKPAKVVHEFVSGTPDKELPQEVKALLPSGFDTKFDETVEPKQPTETTVEVSDGTWTFTSYDADSKVVDEAEEKFVGTWTFTPKKPGGNTPGGNTPGGNTPGTPGEPTPPTPGEPTPPTPPTGTITVTPKAGPSQLPNTGEASTSPLYGVLSLVTGLAGLFSLVKKKKKKTSSK